MSALQNPIVIRPPANRSQDGGSKAFLATARQVEPLRWGAAPVLNGKANIPSKREVFQPVPGRKAVALLDLDKDQCRWPIGEVGAPDFGFCGGVTPEGKPYCEFHLGRAYTGERANGSKAERGAFKPTANR